MPWIRDLEFCRQFDCRDPDRSSGFQDRSFARQWVQQFTEDKVEMLAMRTLLWQEDSVWGLFRMSDETVIDHIADLLVSGRLHVHMGPVRPAGLGSGEQSPGSPTLARLANDKKFVAFPVSERRPTAPEVTFHAAPVDPPTFSSDMNAAAQAATLVAAAAQGKAFCLQ
jgi:hypothetical protein